MSPAPHVAKSLRGGVRWNPGDRETERQGTEEPAPSITQSSRRQVPQGRGPDGTRGTGRLRDKGLKNPRPLSLNPHVAKSLKGAGPMEPGGPGRLRDKGLKNLASITQSSRRQVPQGRGPDGTRGTGRLRDKGLKNPRPLSLNPHVAKSLKGAGPMGTEGLGGQVPSSLGSSVPKPYQSHARRRTTPPKTPCFSGFFVCGKGAAAGQGRAGGSIVLSRRPGALALRGNRDRGGFPSGAPRHLLKL